MNTLYVADTLNLGLPPQMQVHVRQETKDGIMKDSQASTAQ